MTRINIVYCPYCGSQDVHELQRVEASELESVMVCCLSCDEQCVIDRDVNYQYKAELELEAEQKEDN
jgi:hypothetical protein